MKTKRKHFHGPFECRVIFEWPLAMMYSAIFVFGQAKLGYIGLVLGSSQFSILPQQNDT